MSKKLLGIIFLLFVILLLSSCYCNKDSTRDKNKKILEVENEIPQYLDQNPYAAFVNYYDNILNQDLNKQQPKVKLDDLLKQYKIPGACIVVIDNYKIDWVKGYGIIHNEKRIKVKPDTYFEAGSTTKILTAALVMKLAEQSKLDLDKNVNDYLKSWKIPESPLLNNKIITIRNLLSHTAGISEGNNFGTNEDKIPTIPHVLEGNESVTNPPLEIKYKPGTKWKYSNFGFIIIQLLLEDYLDRPYAELMQEYIFDPLGMSRSTFAHYDKREIRNEVIVPHDESGTPHERSMHPTIKAHGELLVSPNDLAKFTIELMKAYVGKPNSLFSQKTAQEMLKISRKIKPEELYGIKNVSYGYGAFLLGEGDKFYFMHTGNNAPGASCMLIANPETGKAAVIMSNGKLGMISDIQLVMSISLVYDWPYISIEE